MPNVTLKLEIENKETNKPITETVTKKTEKRKEEKKMKNVNYKLFIAGIGLMLSLTAEAVAVGTAAGTNITNTATLGFKVAGTSQTPVPSNTTTFVVDKKINFTVSEIAPIGTTTVSTGASGVLTYQVDNQSNYTADYLLSAINASSGDDFDPSSVTAFVESGANAGYQALEDTASYLDNLPSGDTKVVYIVGAIPLSTLTGQTCTAYCNGDDSIVHLQAQAAAASGSVGSPGAALTAIAATDADTSGEDNIFADAAGTASGDSAKDGKHSDDDSFTIATASLSIVKSDYVVWDPVNCTGTAAALTPRVSTAVYATECGSNLPKRIPGAVIHYQMAITNGSSTTAAEELSLADTISSDQTYLAGTIFVDGNSEDDNSTGTDDTPLDVGNPTAGNVSGATVTGSIFSLPASSSKNIHFAVTIK